MAFNPFGLDPSIFDGDLWLPRTAIPRQPQPQFNPAQFQAPPLQPIGGPVEQREPYRTRPFEPAPAPERFYGTKAAGQHKVIAQALKQFTKQNG